MERKVRVRFAPSPTGPLHIGGVRTALFNYLFAKQHGGDFLLRIEDTDSNRFVPGAEAYIIETFKWLGLPFDEGVGIGGDKGPYRQSERRDLYRVHVQRLLDAGKAYYAFDTPEELEAMRKRLEAAKASSQQYDATTRMGMKNSLSLSADEVKALLAAGTPYVVRVKVEPGQEIVVHDMIRGAVHVQSDILDDKVLYKSADDLPTYHLANIVDDYLMEISHVIRGEEWLPSAPLHVLLYRYLGWEDRMPAFAHLPLLLKPDGNGKLSKRDGDRLGFPVFPLQWTDPQTGAVSSGYRESGYYPEAVINMLAFLGWNPGTEQEIFTLDELVKAFDLEKVSKSGAKFNLDKAHWYNRHYLQQHTAADLLPALQEQLKDKPLDAAAQALAQDRAACLRMIDLVKDRLTFPSDLYGQLFYFFEAPTAYDEKVVKKRWQPEMPAMIQAWWQAAEATDFSVAALDALTERMIGERGWNTGKFYNSLRVALVGTSMGPHLFDIMALLGRAESGRRLTVACEKIGQGL